MRARLFKLDVPWRRNKRPARGRSARSTPRWSALIQRALDDRPDPWQRVHQAADPEAADRTLAFIDYALEEADSIRRS